jgi:ABC-type amino acid transport substrate-binding protein
MIKIKKRGEIMEKKGIKYFAITLLLAMLCLVTIILPQCDWGEEPAVGGQQQLVDALDAAFVRMLDSGEWRTIVAADPVAGPLVVNIADCYPRIFDDDVEIYPFPENPTGLLADILANKQIRVGSYRVDDVPGTFHIFDDVNELIMRAIIDELGNGYGLDNGSIEIVHVDVFPPSSNRLYNMLNSGKFDITNFNAALGATALDQRRRKLALFTCSIFGTHWYIHVKESSAYQTMDDVVADTNAKICVGQLSSRLSEDFFKNAQSIDKQFEDDDLVVCSNGVDDGTYDAYLHFDPTPTLPGLRSIPMGIISGIPIWVAKKP